MAGLLLKHAVLFGDAVVVEELFLFEDLLLGGFEDGVEAAEDGHGQDDVAVFAADVEISE